MIDGKVVLKTEAEEVARKKVQFVDMNGTAAECANEPQDSTNQTYDQSNSSNTSSLESFHGAKNFLKISPSEELIFSIVENECISTMLLSNIIFNTIAFKVKTTSPSKYRVRPSVGIIRPGGSAKIKITLLHNKSLVRYSTDKFLVVAMQLDDENVILEELATLWQTVLPENRMEHKIRCSSIDVHNQKASSPNYASPEALAGPSSLVSKVDKLLVQNDALQKEVRGVRKTFYFLIFLQLLFAIGVALMFHYDMMPYCDFHKNKRPMDSCHLPIVDT